MSKGACRDSINYTDVTSRLLVPFPGSGSLLNENTDFVYYMYMFERNKYRVKN